MTSLPRAPAIVHVTRPVCPSCGSQDLTPIKSVAKRGVRTRPTACRTCGINFLILIDEPQDAGLRRLIGAPAKMTKREIDRLRTWVGRSS